MISTIKITVKPKKYVESRIILAEDAKELATIAVDVVSMNGSGGFPARRPERHEMVIRRPKQR